MIRRLVQYTCIQPDVAGLMWSTGCKDCRKRQAPDLEQLSVVISSCNEADLQNTIDSIRASTTRPVEIVVVDDASAPPVPGAAIRNARRIGSPQSRRLGVAKAIGPWVILIDGHMRFPEGNLDRLIDLARDTGGIAYCGCNGHKMAHMRLMSDGLLFCKWTGAKPHGQLYPQWKQASGTTRIQTNGMMGASYVAHKDTWEKMGGWVALPGMLGSQELTMSLIAARCGVPIWADTEIENWHEFRNETQLPFSPDHAGWMLNMACAYRFTFEDAAWQHFRARLAEGWQDSNGVCHPIPESILKEAESPALMEVGRSIRSRFTVSDQDFMAKFGLSVQ